MIGEYSPQQVKDHVWMKAKEIIDYARETERVGEPSESEVNRNVREVLFFIYHMNK